MSKPDDTMLPATPTTERALPAEGETSSGSRTAPVAVPPPSSLESERKGAGSRAAPARSTRGSHAAGNGRPDDPAELRQEIAETRARMSSTLDVLEARLAQERASLERKKTEVVEMATLKPVREKLSREPWRSIAIAFVAGYVVAAIRD
jgi:ElaB/YqjD/DUF883 family membrane-anchored ribosome-binding protein